MGQTPSKKIGRTKSKELSHYDSFSKRPSTSSEPAPPLAGNLVIPPLSRGDVKASGADAEPLGSNSLEVSTPGARKGPAGVQGQSTRGRGNVSSGAAAAGAAVQGRSKSPPPPLTASSPDDTQGGANLEIMQEARNTGSVSSLASKASSGTITSVPSNVTMPNIPTTQTITAPSDRSANPFRSSSPPPPSAFSTSPQANLSAPGAAGSNLSTSPSPLALGTTSLSGNTFNRTLDVDNMISRLLEAGYSGKVTKSPPLKNAEIAAVCLAAREVFLSQPTLIELSPPVKIVGDVHGQVRIGFCFFFVTWAE
jgi:hypothetical protein